MLEFLATERGAAGLGLLRRKLRSWAVELRAPFLTATIVPIFLGTAIAWARATAFYWDYFLLTLAGGLLLHLGTNVANDYFDHVSRDDELNVEFVRPFGGGSRMIQLGLLTPMEVLCGSLLFFALGSLIGLYLTWMRGWIVLLLGIVGVFSGFFYTAPLFNLASHGIGETVVSFNFGVLMCFGAFYIQTQTIALEPFVAAIPVSLLIAAVLYINQFQDYHADKAVGKCHLVVRLVRQRASDGYAIIMVATYASIIMGVALRLISTLALLGLLTLPLAVKAMRHARVYHSRPFELVPANALTIVVHLVTGLLLSVGYVLEGFAPQIIAYPIVVGIITAAILFIFHRRFKRKVGVLSGMKESLK